LEGAGKVTQICSRGKRTGQGNPVQNVENAESRGMKLWRYDANDADDAREDLRACWFEENA